jgi:hypothetical protein
VGGTLGIAIAAWSARVWPPGPEGVKIGKAKEPG